MDENKLIIYTNCKWAMTGSTHRHVQLEAPDRGSCSEVYQAPNGRWWYSNYKYYLHNTSRASFKWMDNAYKSLAEMGTYTHTHIWCWQLYTSMVVLYYVDERGGKGDDKCFRPHTRFIQRLIAVIEAANQHNSQGIHI